MMVESSASFRVPASGGEACGDACRYVWSHGDREDGLQRALLCVHGITRNRHDFSFLASRFASQFDVHAVDLLGHGDSDSLSGAPYTREIFLAQLQHLMSLIGRRRIGFLGSSYGGLMGMRLAAMEDSPIGCLVLNDASAALQGDFFRQTARRISFRPVLPSLQSAEGWMRLVFRNSGALTDDVFRDLALRGTRRLPQGGYELTYDPQIAGLWLGNQLTETEHWTPWRRIRCPVLVVRGKQSSVLTDEGLEAMRASNPGIDVIEIDGVGHFPHLMSDQQADPVRRWLLEHL
jgi:pimeloyl-ACP methyl ester carboxylesterase